jgi:DNA-binding CsgD family transcriptional regulator
MDVGNLTPRQTEAIRAYAQTGSIKQAAAQMGLAPITVRHYLEDARARTGLPTSVQLVVAVIEADARQQR